MQPIYTASNTTAAYQINWSLALFGKTSLPNQSTWLPGLKTATEKDGVRILSVVASADNVLQFLISSRPEVPPSDCVRSVKGRLQYLLRENLPVAFRRNYHVQSVGEVSCEVLDRYVAGQTVKHPMGDPRVQSQLEVHQYHDEDIDLSQCTIGTYGQYLNSLHIVLEMMEGWHEVRASAIEGIRDIIIRAAHKKGWRLSRIGLLSNHVHILLGGRVTTSPQEVVLSLMNNIAFLYDMKSILKYSYYVGTFSGYDRGAIRMHVPSAVGMHVPSAVVGSAGRGPDGGPEHEAIDGSCQL